VSLNWHQDVQPLQFGLRAVRCEPGGDFAFYISAAPGQRCVIESSSDLTNWFFFALATNAPNNYRVTDGLNLPRRFYRARTE
ncbi:MAG: hypothetical protein QOF48_3315, partial [Verrucomicrobiota bacterium]